MILHDKNGQVLDAGDLVTLQARVTSTSTGEDYCNLSLLTVESLHPEFARVVRLNANLVELVEKAEP